MKRAALGIKMHSGWGVIVVVSGDAASGEVIERRRIVVMDAAIAGSKQPFHYAEEFELPAAETYIANCTLETNRLAAAAIEESVNNLAARGYKIAGAALLIASGKLLPGLSQILASHTLIHTAEGEFYREAAKKACERLKISVTPMREKDLDELARKSFGAKASQIQDRIAKMGKSIGPPWTSDHKAATLAAWMIL